MPRRGRADHLSTSTACPGGGKPYVTDERPYYQMTAREALDVLGTSEEGLSRDEAERRRLQYGPNQIAADDAPPRWRIFLSQFRDVLVIMLLIAGVISLMIGGARSAAVVFVIVVVNAVIGFVQEYKAERILDRLRELIRSPAKVVVEGQLQELPQDQLVPGDVIQIESGDKVPADVRLLECFDLRTVEFALTGESTPQEKHSNAIKERCVLADRENMAYVGTTVATGNARALVVGTGMGTEMGQIADLAQKTGAVRSPLERELGALANWLTGVAVAVCAGLFAIGVWQGFSLLTGLIYALGVAVAVVPQALPAQVTVALSTASKRLADRNAVVKSLPSVETLGSTTVICTDKTGTLTKNEMTVTTVWFNGREYSISGVGYEPEGGIADDSGEPLGQSGIDEIEILMDAATMASNAEIHPPDDDHPSWYPVGDPTEAALVTMSTKLGTRSPQEDEENPELHEFPFDSERKRMSSIRLFGEREQLAMKGATDSVLSISKFIYRDGAAVPITEEDRDRIRELREEYSGRALRVLAVAYRPLEAGGGDYLLDEVEKDVIFLGLVGMMDPPKEGVKEAVADCHKASIRIIMMTGDHAVTAQAVGKEIGLSADGPLPAYTGEQLEEMGDDELAQILRGESGAIFSRVDPAHKLRIVSLLEEGGEVVAVTGDGVNDAPALKRAAIGVAMGRTGTDVAKEAADLVLLDDSFPTLVQAVREGRTIYSNLKKTVLASLTTNIAELAVVLLGLAAVSMKGWAIPILAIQILAVDLLAEIMPLTSLTFDPPTPEIMTLPPREPKVHIMNLWTSVEVAFFGLLIGALGFVNFRLFMVRDGLTLTADSMESLPYARASTLCYLTIAFCQLLNILSRRYPSTSLFTRTFWSNRVLLFATAGSVGLMMVVVYTRGLRGFLSFAGPRASDWPSLLIAAGVLLCVFEILKLLRRLGAGRWGARI